MDQFDELNEQRFPGRWERIFVRGAIIEEIERGIDVWFVTITYRVPYEPGEEGPDAQMVRLVVSRETRIRDEEGIPLRPRDLREGMIISAIFSRAMTRSIPPQSQAYEITVLESPSRSMVTEGRIVQVNARENYIITVDGNRFSSAIRFNILPNTEIFGPMGGRIELRNLFPGIRVRVEHARFMTASIPPQTNAFVIQIIR